jgi:hypothetical protein
MIDAFQTYKYFMAIKLHLTTDRYDVFESNGRVSCSRSTFEKRNDKFLFYKIGSKFSIPRDLIEYFVANIGYGNTSVIYSSESDEYYNTWRTRKESRTSLFKTQLAQIYNHLEFNRKTYDDLYNIKDNVPELLSLYVGGHVHLETMVILNDFEDYLSKWKPLHMIWSDQFRVLEKIKKFVKYDQDKLQSIYNQYKESLKEI